MITLTPSANIDSIQKFEDVPHRCFANSYGGLPWDCKVNAQVSES